MSKIIFIIGPISSGKSTVASLIRGASVIEIDEIYKSFLRERTFADAYSDEKFQRDCWEEFSNRIKKSALTHEWTVALTTGVNPRFKEAVKKLRGEFTTKIYVMKVISERKQSIERTNQRRGKEKRSIGATKESYTNQNRNEAGIDILIENKGDIKTLRKKVKEVLTQLENKGKSHLRDLNAGPLPYQGSALTD